MPLIRSSLFGAAAFAVLAGLFAPGVQAQTASQAQNYADQSAPYPPPPGVQANTPLKAGEMTLDDVLQAHTQKPPPSKLSATAPLLGRSSGASSEKVMLMQGMQSVLQAPGSGKFTRLKAPQMQAGMPALKPPAAMVAATPPPAEEEESSALPSSSGGPRATDIEQPPVALDEEASASPSMESSAPSGGGANVAAAMRRQNGPPLASAAPVASSSSSSSCSPRVETWTKNCAEAGYPSSYTGKINGETRTVCPSGDLQDVWMENSCTPPSDMAGGTPPPPTQMASANTSGSELPEVKALSPPPAGEPAPALATEEKIPAAETSAPPEIMMASVDASCGAASGLASAGKPMSDLCVAGQASEVTGDGPWRWDCAGSNGGMTVSCAAPAAAGTVSAAPVSESAPATSTAAPAAPAVEAPVMATASSAPEDGKCGAANGMGVDQAPAGDLCAKGVASRVNGGGPWSWACSGINGGSAAACTAPKKTDGVCGSGTSNSDGAMPTNDLCTSGFASAVTGNGPWNWTCAGLHGGAPATCSAEARKDAVCGPASSHGHRETPTDHLCSVGEASAVGGSGPWNWSCAGVNKGASVNCTANLSVNGNCGSANGVAVAKAPVDELCTEGKPTRVTGNGPWNWNCAGTEGGDTQSCTAPSLKEETTASAPAPAPTESGAPAPRAATDTVAGLCGTAANVANTAAPSLDLCAAGNAGAVSSEKGSWVWSCEGASGGSSVSCSAPREKVSTVASNNTVESTSPSEKPVVTGAGCGAAAGQGANKTPSANLCASGKASIVRGKGPWNWTCTKGKQRAACDAPRMVDARCGAANGSIQKLAPAHGLCNAGSATAVAGRGPWLWTCVGSGGGESVSCSAASQAQVRVDGACGAATSARMEIAPASNLCDGGMPSNVYGEGPWTWTCSGVNGGVAASCATPKMVPQAPAPPGPSVNGLCGAANGVTAVVQPMDGLCTSGTATAVSGNGPWNWNCLGQNSGMTVSCTAPLMPPPPVTGACGMANGLPTLTIPKSGLCSAGISSAVSGKGPWTWSCSGTSGGGAVGCVAPLAMGGGGTGLPSLVTPPSVTAQEAPVPLAAPVGPVAGSHANASAGGLVTPRLPSGPLPPLESGSMPEVPKPSGAFAHLPQGAPAPLVAAENVSPSAAAPSPPALPADNAPLPPPPIRDTIKPSPALKGPIVLDADNAPVTGNRFVLDDDVSVVNFGHGAENIDNDAMSKLNKLAGVLQAHGNVRITLTAYAGLDANAAPRDARRLSLARALAARDYLTSKGVSSSRIDVRALGANVPSGDPDRVDVKAN